MFYENNVIAFLSSLSIDLLRTNKIMNANDIKVLRALAGSSICHMCIKLTTPSMEWNVNFSSKQLRFALNQLQNEKTHLLNRLGLPQLLVVVVSLDHIQTYI